MANSGGEDEDWGEGSGDEEEREEGDDDLIEVQPSGSRDSVKPILRLPERNEEDTAWTRADGTKPVSAKNKLKSEDMTTIRKRKDLMWTEVAKNDQDSLVDRWLRDQIKPDTWDKIAQVFPQQGKCLAQQKWVRMTEDTKSTVPIRYQQYGITVKLTPDKHDKTRATFGTLPKTYPTLWVCCAHHDCMTVYDVTSANDTQRKIHLTDHHTLGVKSGHSHQTLHRARLQPSDSAQRTSGYIITPSRAFATEEERMVFSTGGMASLLCNVRSPICSVPCEYNLF
jgi:hypothetical protein